MIKKMKNKKVLTVVCVLAACILIVLAFFLAGWRPLRRNTKTNIVNTTGGSTSGFTQDAVVFELDAIMNTDSYNILVVDPKDGTIIYKNPIKLASNLFPYDPFDVMETAQFDPKTGNIYIYEQGYSDYGYACTDAGGICYSRIYQISRGTNIPKVIYQTSEEVPLYWLIVGNERQLLITQSGDTPDETVTSINLDNLKTKTIIDHGLYRSAGKSHKLQLPDETPILGPDGKTIYFVGNYTDGGQNPNGKTVVLALNFNNFTMSQLPYSGFPNGYVDDGLTVSPDGQIFFDSNASVLYSDDPLISPAGGSNIFFTKYGDFLGWASGAGHLLMYNDGKEITYVDPITQKVSKVTSNIDPIDKPTGIAGYGYNLTKDDNDNLYAYSYQSGKQIKIATLVQVYDLYPRSIVGFALGIDKNLGVMP
jgi:hypothetical protein